MLSQILISTSAVIVLIFGILHLVYTFTSNKLVPRDRAVREQMEQVAPVISKQTTMWRAWIGFNASHSLGLMLFGVVYGYLSIVDFQVLLLAKPLLVFGSVFLASLVVLAKRYWFNIPLAGVACSLVLYVAGAVLAVV